MSRSNMEVVLDCVDPLRLEEFWRAALGYKSLFSAAEIVVLVPDTDGSPPLVLQRVPEGKEGKNRMHIDIVRADVEAEVSRLETWGPNVSIPDYAAWDRPSGSPWPIPTGMSSVSLLASTGERS